MTKLSDTQLLILSAAAQRDGNIALPLPPSLRGGAAKKVVGALLAKGYLAEAPAGREPGTPVWDETDDGTFVTLVATAEGLAAIGIEPNSAPQGSTGPQEGEEAQDDETGDDGATAGDTGAQRGDGPKVRAGTKQARLIAMLRSAEGASIGEIAAATGWQPHTVRGAIAGALKKRLGLAVTSDMIEGRGRVYRIAD